MGRETNKNKFNERKEATLYVASIFLNYPEGPENIIDHQKYNGSDTSMPEEVHYKVKYPHNNMEEKAQDDEYDHQSGDGPYPRTDI